MKEFLKRAEKHLIPSTVGCAFGALVVGGNMWTFLLSIPLCVIIITFLFKKLGLDNDEVQKD